ncbi:MAG: hypothetical protein LBT59_10300 [Clostridiales bacterium]|nr:hypothetical protein [Clostridiales bacterium]
MAWPQNTNRKALSLDPKVFRLASVSKVLSPKNGLLDKLSLRQNPLFPPFSERATQTLNWHDPIYMIIYQTCLICALGLNPLFKPFLLVVNALRLSDPFNLGWAEMLLA